MTTERKGFTIKRPVTLPLWKWVTNEPKYLKVTGEIYTGKAVAKAGKGKDMEPANLMNVINLETGEECQVIVGAVLEGILHDEYPETAYVGLGFEITQTQLEGKRYKGYSVYELELEA